MTLDDLGNIGELIGAIGVIVTLVYLAMQIRQNTHALKNTAHQSNTREASEFTAGIARSGELADIFNKGSRDWAALEDVERLRFSMLMFQLFFNFQNIYTLHENGGIDDEYWESQFSVLMWFLGLPGVRHWWGIGRERLRPSFVAFIDAELAAG